MMWSSEEHWHIHSFKIVSPRAMRRNDVKLGRALTLVLVTTFHDGKHGRNDVKLGRALTPYLTHCKFYTYHLVEMMWSSEEHFHQIKRLRHKSSWWIFHQIVLCLSFLLWFAGEEIHGFHNWGNFRLEKTVFRIPKMVSYVMQEKIKEERWGRERSA